MTGIDAAAAAVAGGTRLDVPALLEHSRVLVCCGSGGVGKTTSAAALGVLAARLGRRVQVLTIDPARRLAQAMGLDGLDFEPRTIALDASGSLAAMMLDSRRAFDRLVAKHAPNAGVRDAIFANAYYQQIASALGGSRELVAMERVLELARARDHDLLIVDTPPSQHALDFLDAPARIIGLLDGSLTGLLMRPYGLAARAQFKLFRRSSSAVLKFLERLTGMHMLADLSDFLLAFSGLFDGFRERSQQVQALMHEPGTRFLLVCTPEPASLRQVDQFAARLVADELQIAGVLANRVSPDFRSAAGAATLSTEARTLLDAASEPGFSPLSQRVLASVDTAAVLARADRRALDALRTGGFAVHEVEAFDHDLLGMADLLAFAERLRRPANA